MDEQMHLDLVADHPYKPGRWGDSCTYLGPDDLWPCGFTKAEHADEGGGAIERPTV